MKISFDSTVLISDVKEDIDLYGGSFKVYAIYAYREIEGQEFEYISSYVDAEQPTRDEVEVSGLFDDNDEKLYQQILSEYHENIESLRDTKHELMSLSELLEKLEEQNRIV